MRGGKKKGSSKKNSGTEGDPLSKNPGFHLLAQGDSANGKVLIDRSDTSLPRKEGGESVAGSIPDDP